MKKIVTDRCYLTLLKILNIGLSPIFFLFSDNAITDSGVGFYFSVRPPSHYLRLHIAFVTNQNQ